MSNIVGFKNSNDEILYVKDANAATQTELSSAVSSINNQMSINCSAIAEMFSDEKSYVVGDIVLHEKSQGDGSTVLYLYSFIAPHSAGAWNSIHVEEIGPVISYVQKKYNDSANNNVCNFNISLFRNDTAYSTGDIVIYDGKIQRFTTSHAAGDWIGTDVENASYSKYINKQIAVPSDSDTLSDIAVANNTETTIQTITLPAGLWSVISYVAFDGNATGIRSVGLTTTALMEATTDPQTFNMDGFTITEENALTATDIWQFVKLNTTIYVDTPTEFQLRAKQTSTSTLNARGRIRCYRVLCP